MVSTEDVKRIVRDGVRVLVTRDPDGNTLELEELIVAPGEPGYGGRTR